MITPWRYAAHCIGLTVFSAMTVTATFLTGFAMAAAVRDAGHGLATLAGSAASFAILGLSMAFVSRVWIPRGVRWYVRRDGIDPTGGTPAV